MLLLLLCFATRVHQMQSVPWLSQKQFVEEKLNYGVWIEFFLWYSGLCKMWRLVALGPEDVHSPYVVPRFCKYMQMRKKQNNQRWMKQVCYIHMCDQYRPFIRGQEWFGAEWGKLSTFIKNEGAGHTAVLWLWRLCQYLYMCVGVSDSQAYTCSLTWQAEDVGAGLNNFNILHCSV